MTFRIVLSYDTEEGAGVIGAKSENKLDNIDYYFPSIIASDIVGDWIGILKRAKMRVDAYDAGWWDSGIHAHKEYEWTPEAIALRMFKYGVAPHHDNALVYVRTVAERIAENHLDLDLECDLVNKIDAFYRSDSFEDALKDDLLLAVEERLAEMEKMGMKEPLSRPSWNAMIDTAVLVRLTGNKVKPSRMSNYTGTHLYPDAVEEESSEEAA